MRHANSDITMSIPCCKQQETPASLSAKRIHSLHPIVTF